MKTYFLIITYYIVFCTQAVHGGMITALLEDTEEDNSIYVVSVIDSEIKAIEPGKKYKFRVSLGDRWDNYIGRKVQGNAVFYSNQWHLESIFPISGLGSKAYNDLNKKFHLMVKSMSRRNFVQENDYILDFSGINQEGDFFQFKDFLGKVVVINFIFTRCQAREMCPASTRRMSILQDKAREMGLRDLHLLSISFDPEYDSPGNLKHYGKSYDIEFDTFTFMTSKPLWIEDLMRYFGIVTIEEDGTINHTMATLLIDQKGRINYRREGSIWKVDDFLVRAQELFEK